MLLAQRLVLDRQISFLSEIQETVKKSSSEVSAVEFPPMLLRRAHAADISSATSMMTAEDFYQAYGLPGMKGRLVSNEEMAFMDILDTDGMISTPARMTNFFVLMTRITKVCGMSD